MGIWGSLHRSAATAETFRGEGAFEMGCPR